MRVAAPPASLSAAGAIADKRDKALADESGFELGKELQRETSRAITANLHWSADCRPSTEAATKSATISDSPLS
jgi:hypothetical protein